MHRQSVVQGKARVTIASLGTAAYCSSCAVNAASASLRLLRKASTSSRENTCSIITKRMRCRPRSRETVDGSIGVRSQVTCAARPTSVGSYTRRRLADSLAPFSAEARTRPFASRRRSAGYNAPELGWYMPIGVAAKIRFRS